MEEKSEIMEEKREDSQSFSDKIKNIPLTLRKRWNKLIGINEEEQKELERIKAIPSKPYYNYEIDEVLKDLDTNVDSGLNEKDIKKRVKEYGFNELPKIRKSIWKVYLAPIFNFLIVILIVSGIVIAILGEITSTIITWSIIIANSITAIVQQYRAQKALESLKKISALTTTVVRNGSQIEIQSREIVPGDIIILKQGDKVPADVRLIESVNLAINEAPLTGESVAIEKITDPINKEDISLQKQHNMAFMGTYVTTGRGKAIATNTGIKSEIGQISQTLNEMGSIEDIPLTKKMNNFAKWLVVLVFINLTILISYKIGMLIILDNVTPDNVRVELIAAILRAMNVIPVNLPLLATLVLITGVLNLAQTGVIIRNLSALESMGRVSVVCTDKTGTITQNQMTVKRFWYDAKIYEVFGVGYNAEGDIVIDGVKTAFENDKYFDLFIKSMVLNNASNVSEEEVKIKAKKETSKQIRIALGSPTEVALIVLAEKAGYNISELKQQFESVQEFSFDSSVKMMSTIFKEKDNPNEIFAFVKGASEIIVERCNKIVLEQKIVNLTKNQQDLILQSIKKFAETGYRTLSIAYKEFSVEEIKNKSFKREEVESDLIFLGFVVILDPPREGVNEAIKSCKSANIDVVMITGDHPATAESIARSIGLFEAGDNVVRGKDIETLSDEDFNKTSVFARVAPTDKEKIVKRYQDQNRIVAMTGDGINDSLALKLANTGIAMGITGTDIAKETADMVISDDNFVSIERGIRTGRGIFSRIRVIMIFFVGLNFMEAIFFFTAEFLPIPGFKLFSNWQHTYIFAIVHSLPSLALVVDTIPKDIMKEPPRDNDEILNKNILMLMVVAVICIGITLALSYYLTFNQVFPFTLNEFNMNPDLSYLDVPYGSNILIHPLNAAHQKARTMCMTVLYFSETFFVWSIRRPNNSFKQSIIDEYDKNLMGMILICVILHTCMVVFSNGLNTLFNDTLGIGFNFNYVFLSLTDWLLVFIFVASSISGIELFKYIARKKKIFF